MKRVSMSKEQISEAIARWETIRDTAVFDGERAVAIRMIAKYKRALEEEQNG